jgi:hypothetical protein
MNICAKVYCINDATRKSCDSIPWTHAEETMYLIMFLAFCLDAAGPMSGH